MRNLLLNKLIYVLTINAQIDALFTYSEYYGSRNLLSTYDGGYLIAPQSYDGDNNRHILKVNQLGSIEWKIKPFSDEELGISNIATLSNGDIIASGETYKYWSPYWQQENPNRVDGVLLRINTCGEVEWVVHQRRHEDINIYESLRWLTVDSLDNIWVSFYVSYENKEQRDSVVDGKLGARAIMNKYSPDGELLATTNDIFDHLANITSIESTNDGGVIATSSCSLLPFYDQVHDPTTNPLYFDRSSVIKYDEYGEIEWFDAYRWEEDQVYDIDSFLTAENEKIVSSRGADILLTDSNTYLVSATRYFFSPSYNSTYTKFLLYELDEDGNMLRDSIYDYHRNASIMSFEVLDDSTLVFECTSIPFDDFTQGAEAHLEIWKIDSRTWDIKGRFIDSSTVNYIGSSIAVTPEKKILLTSYQQNSLGAQLRVINSETMTLDTVPAVDTLNYDYLCTGTFTPAVITLPADTNIYEPYGYTEFDKINLGLYVKDKVLHLSNLESSNYAYQIVNTLGQVVELGAVLPSQINLQHLDGGIYFLQLPDVKEVVKFVL